MGLVFQTVLSFIPVKQCPQDGGKTILSKRAHSADQLWRKKEVTLGNLSVLSQH